MEKRGYGQKILNTTIDNNSQVQPQVQPQVLVSASELLLWVQQPWLQE